MAGSPDTLMPHTMQKQQQQKQKDSGSDDNNKM